MPAPGASMGARGGDGSVRSLLRGTWLAMWRALSCKGRALIANQLVAVVAYALTFSAAALALWPGSSGRRGGRSGTSADRIWLWVMQ